MTNRINDLRELFFAGDHKRYRVEDLGLSILDGKNDSLPFGIRKALSFKLATEKMPIFIQGDELIVGGKTVYILPEYVTAYEKEIGNPNFETKGYRNAFDNCFNLGQDERGYGVADSSVPAYYRILPTGIPALIANVKERLAKTNDPQSKIYYESVIIVHEAIIALMGRFIELIRVTEGKTDAEERKKELRQMAENISVIASGPPKTYWQALQLMYFIQYLVWTEGGYLVPLGRVDQFMYPFYKADKEAGILNDEFALELMENFFMKLNYEIDRTHGEAGKFESDTGQSVTIGGVDPKTGADVTNELTYMILDAKCDMRVTDPKVHLRLHKNSPEAVWKKAAYLNSLGMGFPTYENDDALIPAFMKHDCYTLEDARDYCASGCWEIIIQGKSMNRNLGLVDCLRYLEWALNDGQSFSGPPAPGSVGLIDGQYGLKTGRLEWFTTYDKLFNAFKVQMKHGIDMTTSYCNRSQVSPSPLYSSVMDDCIERGRDIDAGGCRYYEIDFQMSSLSNASDALYAIKKLVYEEKAYTLRQFVDILKSNWEGEELLRQRILNEFPKFGNDNDEVDKIAAEIVKYFEREVTKHRNNDGGPYRARISSALAYVNLARTVGASADGRLAGSFYSNNLSPQMGADKNGPTAIVSSCGKLDYSGCAGGAVLDMKFHPSALKTEEGREKFSALIKAYFAQGGMQAQINVLDNETLKDAKAHPEKYRDLIVRVWGFSTYFVSLPEAFQDHIIERSTLST